MKMQLNVKAKTIDVYYFEGKFMKSKHLNTEKISDEDINRIESMLEYFKDLKEEDVHVQSESNSSS
tara:strand:- start:444 stop:641 length:198 start_codon:yes stop_codon:yes gene_type:complete